MVAMTVKLRRARRNTLVLISAAALVLPVMLMLIPGDRHFVGTLHSQFNGSRFGAYGQWRTESTERGVQRAGDLKSQALTSELNQSCSSLQGSQADDGVEHIFFLKVHKAGSTSVTNLLYRYALRRSLNVALRRAGRAVGQRHGKWGDNIQPLRPTSGVHYDILAAHVVFNDTAVRQWLPADTKYVAIVRHPFEQFVSAFYYYRDVLHNKRLMKVPGEDPIWTILSEPDKWEAELSGCHTMVSNRMSCDFGVPFDQMQNRTFLESYLRYLDGKFHLVMIAEYFNESLIFLKRLLSWSLKDVLYICLFNRRDHRHHHLAPAQATNFRQTRLADFMLYEHFLAVFRQKVTAEGEDFAKEVKTFDRTRREVEEFCRGRTNVSGVEPTTLTVEATKYSSCFFVTARDCDFLSTEFFPLTSQVRASMREKGIFS